ncbi:hypothetical protein [Martelella sp. HB161492]|uniref:hypothetical protein n=1 Tax=Martelella sp. HB161492 TaxID=2720726 RepID=UPI0015910EAB|nr:hypothetical protein [Martelella sp. HB161492]
MEFRLGLRLVWEESFSLLFANIKSGFRLLWPILALVIVTQMFFPTDISLTELNSMSSSARTIILFLFPFGTIVGFVVIPSFLIGWHRLILLDEQPGWFSYRLGARQWRYILACFLFWLISLLLIIPAGLFLVFITSLGAQGGLILAPIFALIGLAIAYFATAPNLARFALALPAVALDRPIAFKAARRMGAGLGLPMAVAFLGLFLVGLLISMFLGLVAFVLSLIATLMGPITFVVPVIKLIAALPMVVTNVYFPLAEATLITVGYRIALKQSETNEAQPASDETGAPVPA